MKSVRTGLPLRVAGIYAIFAGVWILLSDWAISLIASDPSQLTFFQTYKGSVFVFVTAFLLYLLLQREWSKLQREVRARQQTEEFLNRANSELEESIADQQEMLAVLNENEELLKRYLEEAPDCVYISDMDANFLYGNHKCEELLGYKREELVGKNFLTVNLLKESSLAHATGLFQASLEGKSTGPDEVELVRKDGSHVTAEINTAVMQREGKPVILAFVRDITERKQAAVALHEAHERLRKISDNLPGGLVYQVVFDEKDQWRRFTYISAGVEQLHGFTADQVLNDATLLYGQIVEKDSQLLAEREAVALTNMSPFTAEVRIKWPPGEIRWIQLSSAPHRLAEHQVLWDGIEIDITDRKKNEEDLKKSIERVRKALGATVQAMAATVEARDPYTAGHQRRVADLARSIATEMKLTFDQIDGIRMAGIIHDLGKISVPAEILSKPGRLTELEFGLVKMHVDAGYAILKEIDFSQPVARIVYEHHERMDGSGYPNGLKGDEILIESRIMAVADVVEAIASHRPYRPALGVNVALEEIEKNKGIFYDADAADSCLRLFREKGYQLPVA